MGTQGAMGYRGIGHMAIRPMGQKGTGGMDTGVWGTWPIRPTGGVGYRGYGAHGQQATIGTGGMGYRGYGPHG